MIENARIRSVKTVGDRLSIALEGDGWHITFSSATSPTAIRDLLGSTKKRTPCRVWITDENTAGAIGHPQNDEWITSAGRHGLNLEGTFLK